MRSCVGRFGSSKKRCRESPKSGDCGCQEIANGSPRTRKLSDFWCCLGIKIPRSEDRDLWTRSGAEAVASRTMPDELAYFQSADHTTATWLLCRKNSFGWCPARAKDTVSPMIPSTAGIAKARFDCQKLVLRPLQQNLSSPQIARFAPKCLKTRRR